MHNQKAAVESGQWPLYRYNPALVEQGENPLLLDSRAPRIPLEQYMYMEGRFKMLARSRPDEAQQLLEEAQRDVDTRWSMYEYLASRQLNSASPGMGARARSGHYLPGTPRTAVIRESVLMPSRALKLGGPDR
jgi:hypothetical protein